MIAIAKKVYYCALANVRRERNPAKRHMYNLQSFSFHSKLL